MSSAAIVGPAASVLRAIGSGAGRRAARCEPPAAIVGKDSGATWGPLIWELGAISPTGHKLIIESCKKYFCSDLNSFDPFMPQICTCHGSWTVAASVKLTWVPYIIIWYPRATCVWTRIILSYELIAVREMGISWRTNLNIGRLASERSESGCEPLWKEDISPRIIVCLKPECCCWSFTTVWGQTSNIRRTLVGNKLLITLM